MPPFGLYPIPRNHLYGGSPSRVRPVFNSMDFRDDVSATDDGDAAQPVSNDVGGEGQVRDKKDKKRKKKRSLDAHGGEEVTKAKGTTASSKVKKDKDKKKEKDTGEASTSKKKRKRESETQADAPTAVRAESSNHSSVLDSRFVQDVKTMMGDIGATFSQSVQAVQTTEKPLKKKKKSSSKTDPGVAKTKASEGAVTAATNGSVPAEPVAKKKRGRPRKETLETVSVSPAKIPVASIAPPYATAPKKTHIPLPPKSPKKTPVPLPLKSLSQQARAMSEPQHSQTKTNRKGSEVLVAETPPSQMPTTPVGILKTPIPFSLSQKSGTASTGNKKRKKGPTIDISPPTTVEGSQTPTPAPATRRNVSTNITGSQTSIPLSTILRYMEPLNDEPKPRPRGRAASVASSASSMSIKEAFARAPKPRSYSDAESSPSVGPEAKNKKHSETHPEGDMETFTDAFHASQKTVNFTVEREHLDQHLHWRAENSAAGPLPCLNQATGCNAQREQMLRLSKEDATHMLRVLVTSEADASALEAATQRCTDAERFLAHAVTARVPVPLGRLDGVWKLYCPKYSESHVDKYGFGQRELVLARIAGFRSLATYTARLSLPPRSMPFTLRGFDAPPHASFRTTTLKTSEEAYAMDIVFLGNGFLHLRVDLHLLLKGKPMEEVDGKSMVMEFVGVNEKVVL